MKNRKFGKVLASIAVTLCLVLTGCQGITTTSSQTTTTTSQQENAVTSITIAASSDSNLNQISGSESKVTINATLNAGANSNTSLAWYVDDALVSTQTTTKFEYKPETTGNHKIVAKCGSVTSNEIIVNVKGDAFVDPVITAIDNDTVKIVADYGLNITVEGNSIAKTSNYNIAEKVYYIDLTSKMVQGRSYKFSFSKTGYETRVQNFIYDTRVLEVASVVATLNSVSTEISKEADGTYTIVKPFEDSAQMSYTITFKHENLESTDAIKKSNVSFVTSCPSGEACTTSSKWNASQNTNMVIEATTDISKTYSQITNKTTNGTYTHTVSVEDVATGLKKTIEVNVVIKSSTPTVEMSGKFYYGDSGSSGAYSGSDYSKNGSIGDADNVVKPNETTGAYEVELPYLVNKGKQIKFLVVAKNYATNASNVDYSNIFLSNITTPSGASNIYYKSKSNSVGKNDIITLSSSNGNYFGSTVTATVDFFVDSTTQPGEYKFTFNAYPAGSGAGSGQTFSVVILVKAAVAKIEETITYNGQVLEAASDGSYIFYKPLTAGVTYDTTFKVKITNLDSIKYNASSALTADDGVAGRYLDSDNQYRYLLTYSVGDYSTKLAVEMGAAADKIVKKGAAETNAGSKAGIYTLIQENSNVLELDLPLNYIKGYDDLNDNTISGHTGKAMAYAYEAILAYAAQFGDEASDKDDPLGSAPTDWSTKYNDYYKRTGEGTAADPYVYTKLSESSAPTFNTTDFFKSFAKNQIIDTTNTTVEPKGLNTTNIGKINAIIDAISSYTADDKTKAKAEVVSLANEYKATLASGVTSATVEQLLTYLSTAMKVAPNTNTQLAQFASITTKSSTTERISINIQFGSLKKTIILQIKAAGDGAFYTASEVASKQETAGKSAYLWSNGNKYNVGSVIKDNSNSKYYVVNKATTNKTKYVASTSISTDIGTDNNLVEIPFAKEVVVSSGVVLKEPTKENGLKNYVIIQPSTKQSVTVNAFPYGFTQDAYVYSYSYSFDGEVQQSSQETATAFLYADNTNLVYDNPSLKSGNMFTKSFYIEKVGTYVVTFKMGKATKVITIEVVSAPGFEVEELKSGSQEAIYFNGAYYLKANDNSQMTISTKLKPVNCDKTYFYTYQVQEETTADAALSTTTAVASTGSQIKLSSEGLMNLTFTINGVAFNPTTTSANQQIKKFVITINVYEPSETDGTFDSGKTPTQTVITLYTQKSTN